MARTISLSVDVDDDMELPKVMEILSRHACGLIMEGLDVRIFAYTVGEDGTDGMEELFFEDEEGGA